MNNPKNNLSYFEKKSNLINLKMLKIIEKFTIALSIFAVIKILTSLIFFIVNICYQATESNIRWEVWRYSNLTTSGLMCVILLLFWPTMLKESLKLLKESKFYLSTCVIKRLNSGLVLSCPIWFIIAFILSIFKWYLIFPAFMMVIIAQLLFMSLALSKLINDKSLETVN